MMISDRLLRRFCAADRTRWGDKTPVTIGRYTYATNGFIFIRVPAMKRYPRVGKNELRGNERFYDTMIPPLVGMKFIPLALPEKPAHAAQYCHRCEGEKRTKWDGRSKCTVCDGTGRGACYNPVRLGDTFIAWHHLYLISLLPSPRIAFQTTATDAIPFRFAGGVGVVAPKIPR